MTVSDLRSVHIATLGRDWRCVISRFRRGFVSHSMEDIVAESEWLLGHGVTEVMLLSEGALQDGHLGQEEFEGRAEHQASGTDGTVVFSDKPRFDPGMIVKARVTGAEGIDLVVERA